MAIASQGHADKTTSLETFEFLNLGARDIIVIYFKGTVSYAIKLSGQVMRGTLTVYIQHL